MKQSVRISIEYREFKGRWMWKGVVQKGMETRSFKKEKLEDLILEIMYKCEIE